MGINLIEAFETEISDAQVAALGGQLGLAPDVTAAAFAKMKPIILAALIRLGSQTDGGPVVARLLDQADPEGGLLDRVPEMLSSGSAEPLMVVGGPVLRSLFGDAFAPVVSSLASDTGVKQGAMEGLLAMLVPIVLGVVGKQKASLRLDASGLQKMLKSQKVASIGDVSAGPTERSEVAPREAANPVEHVSRTTASSGLGKTILLAAAVFALFFYGVFRFLNGGNFPGGFQKDGGAASVQETPLPPLSPLPPLPPLGAVPADPITDGPVGDGPVGDGPISTEPAGAGDSGAEPLDMEEPTKDQP